MSGLFAEVESLEKFKDLNSLQTIGYKEVFDFLDGNLSQKECIEEIKKNSRRYAKRQLTWLRRDREYIWTSEKNSEILGEEIKRNS